MHQVPYIIIFHVDYNSDEFVATIYILFDTRVRNIYTVIFPHIPVLLANQNN